MDVDLNRIFVVAEEADPETEMAKWFRRTPTGLDTIGQPSLEAFELMGLILLRDFTTLRWQFGGWAVALAEVHGMDAYERLSAKLMSERTARTVEDWAYVYRGVTKRVRREDLSFSHHRKVVPLRRPDLQAYWLERAFREEWGVRRLAEEIARSNGEPPPPRKNDRMFEMEMENARLHRRVDALTREADACSERSESILESIRTALREIVEAGPDALARNPVGAHGMLKALLEKISG